MPEKKETPPAPKAPGAPRAAEILAALKGAGIEASVASTSPGVHDTAYVVVVKKGT